MRNAGVALDLFVRRLVHRHEDHAIQAELEMRLLSADEVAEVRRVERASEEADIHPRI